MVGSRIILDSRQQSLLELLIRVAALIKPRSFFVKLQGALRKQSKPKGIYLHGSVGTGKTMLMKMFYEKLQVSKEIIHYQKFMHNIHKKLHLLQHKTTDKLVQELATSIARRSQVVCMDEFEIKDITDAMIIMRLFEYLLKNGVFIFITSNTTPDLLYKDGLQRESFLPFIENIKKQFQILCLDNEIDYRYNAVSKVSKRILFPFSKENKETINNIKLNLCDKDEVAEVNIDVFGRRVAFAAGHQNTLFTNFKELFERDLGYADYVNITERFNIIVVEGARAIDSSETDIATRFINFVDHAYFNRIVLFMEIECHLEEMYPNGHKVKEFKRTISRLNEMNSDQYTT
ncbi:MAG: cell division protein ZapE [Rickettsiaceae bacterium]